MNPRQLGPQPSALPLSYSRHNIDKIHTLIGNGTSRINNFTLFSLHHTVRTLLIFFMNISKIRALKTASDPKPIVCLTAYTAPVALIADKHADLILVGDSLGMVLYGMKNTLAVTTDMMIAHGKAVVNNVSQSCVVVDMPFGSYQESPETAFRNAARIMAETGCDAVKLEGGEEMAETVSCLTRRGIPVMGHTGLQPQSVNTAGGFKKQGKDKNSFEKILRDSRSIDKAGAFCLVLECVVPELARKITGVVSVPTIGIGASADCDGQILVTEDILGFTSGKSPGFVKKYENLSEKMDYALTRFSEDVRNRNFPET